MFPATLFDFNGVLVDDEAVHLAAFREVLSPLGVELTEQAYWERYLGYDDAGAFRAILGDAGKKCDDALVVELIERKRPHYLSRARAALVTFPGAREAIERAAQYGPVCIVSGALRDEIELGLSVIGARQHIAEIVSAEDTRACKPDPEGYELGKAALRRLAGERAAERALVIEDSVAGVRAAKSAKLACLAVTHSYPRETLLEAGADRVIEKLGDLSDEILSGLYRALHA